MAVTCKSFMTITAFSLVLLAGIGCTTALLGGSWVGVFLEASDDKGSSSSSFGFGPKGVCLVLSSTSCTPPGEVEKKWDQVQVFFDGKSDKQNVGTLLVDIRNLMITASIACAFCVIVYIPFLLRDVCGGISQVKCCGRWTAICGGAAAIGGGGLALAAFGAMFASDVRKVFLNLWDTSSITIGSDTFKTASGDTAFFFCAAAAGALAVIGGLLIVLRGTVCAGKEEAHDTAPLKDWK